MAACSGCDYLLRSREFSELAEETVGRDDLYVLAEGGEDVHHGQRRANGVAVRPLMAGDYYLAGILEELAQLTDAFFVYDLRNHSYFTDYSAKIRFSLESAKYAPSVLELIIII